MRLAALLLASLWLAGCGPKLMRTRVYEDPTVRVELRHREKGGEVLAHDYSHPATISDVRIAHILANLSFQDSDKKQRAVIRSEHAYPLGEGIAKALEQAGPNDEVAAAAFPTDKRLGIFNDDKVTAFRLWLEGDDLKIEFFLIEAPLEKDGNKLSYREWEIPAERTNAAPDFTLVPGEAQTRLGADGVAVAWRDDFFRKPVARGTGTGRRRTVLMELPPDESEKKTAPAQSSLPTGLSDEQIRALDRADADRSTGAITESQYQHRRRLILENRIDEAGYGKEP